jgi:glycyl-tRNA synthetase beta chain
MSLPFLLEIGVGGDSRLDDTGRARKPAPAVREAGDSARIVTLDATARRLVLRAEGLPERQADSQERVLGPAKSAPAQAVEGFARKQGVKPEDLTIETTAKGEYYSFIRKVPGRLTKDILAAALPGIILQIYFPKTMYWTGKGGPRFIRPIRWMVAMLGEEIVPFELAGVAPARSQFRPPPAGRAERSPSRPADYERAPARPLRDPLRRGTARPHPQGLAGVRIKPDPALLETLVYLTEYPTPIVGSFDPQFLELPEEVLVTVMRHHQKYFRWRTPRQAGAPICDGHEHRCRSRRLRPPRQ